MSDSFQSYVFREKGRHSPASTFGRVKEWLVGEKVIGTEVAENALGEKGHVPGAHASSILIKDDDDWRSLADNGVFFEVGRIIEASTELQSGMCPDCNNDFPVDSEAFSIIDDALARYRAGGTGVFLCPHCARDEHLSDWDFGHGLAIGTAKVTFWNWPEHVSDLDERFFDLSGMWCTKVWGKI